MATRGYAKWNPNNDARYWIARTRQVLEAYESYWPLSVRQVFYRLVAEHDYEKTEAAYSKLTGLIGRGRRAGYISWAAIRDGGLGRSLAPSFFDGADDFEASVRSAAENLMLDRQRDQSVSIELWCEAGGMVPILSGIARPYSAQVNTGGGYDSVTAKHRLAERVRRRAEDQGQKTLILHVGDFDGSGEDMCSVLREDAGAMVATQVMQSIVLTHKRGDTNWTHAPGWLWEDLENRGESVSERFVDYVYDWFEVERVALTGQQVVDRAVITAPTKKTDSRTAGFVERNWDIAEQLGTRDISAQLEALTPPELEELISGVVEARLDMDVYRGVLEDERAVRAVVLEWLDG
jgi:hypothetical protein